MSVRDVLVLYALIGVACAVAVVHRAPQKGLSTLLSAVATVPLWPLWAPFALVPTRGGSERDDPIVRRVSRALEDAVLAVAGTPMDEVFNEATAKRIGAEVTRVAGRLAELRRLATERGFDRVASARRLEELERSNAPERVLATARLQHESLERLERLRAADARALEELAELLEALRTQLVLARYAGSRVEGASALVGEVWSRLEGLGAVLDESAS